jgi:hypothetical protein
MPYPGRFQIGSLPQNCRVLGAGDEQLIVNHSPEG